MEEMQLHPAWKNAVAVFAASAFPYGHVLTREWLYRQFSVEMPRHDTPHGIAQKLELQFMQAFTAFRETLLCDFQIDLQTKAGVGYVIVAPSDQTRLAFDDGMRGVRKALRGMARRITEIRLDELTPEQQKANADAQAKLAALAAAVRRPLLITG